MEGTVGGHERPRGSPRAAVREGGSSRRAGGGPFSAAAAGLPASAPGGVAERGRAAGASEERGEVPEGAEAAPDAL